MPRRKKDIIREVRGLLNGRDFAKMKDEALGELDRCMSSRDELERFARVLDDRERRPEERLDALFTISAAYTRGLDISCVEGTLERASADRAPQIAAFACGLLAKHRISKGDIPGACSLYDRGGHQARAEIGYEAAGHVLQNGYEKALEPLLLRILTDANASIGTRLRETLSGSAGAELSALMLGASAVVRDE